MQATSKPFRITVNHTFPTKARREDPLQTIRSYCHPFQSRTRRTRSSTSGCPAASRWAWRMTSRCRSLSCRRPSTGRSTSRGPPSQVTYFSSLIIMHERLRRSLWLQWAPSPCCKLCSCCSATPATFLFRSALCRIRYDKKCDKIWYWVQFKVYPKENALCMFRCTCHAPSSWCSRGWGSGWTGRPPQTESP